jgi:Icc-related predicted phosphoesterase
MKVLAASDIHGYYAVYSWLVQKAREKRVDFLLLAGDLLGCPRGYETVQDAQRHDAATITGILRAIELPIYYIMGNDDLVELDPCSDQFTSIHSRRVELPDGNLVGYQYSPLFIGGVHEKPEEEIRADLAQLAGLVDRGTILVTHSPAHGVLDVGLLDLHAGSQAILDLVRSRDVRAHIHGHMHYGFGRVGRHFNVASGGKRRAMIIDLESLASTAEQDTVDGA